MSLFINTLLLFNLQNNFDIQFILSNNFKKIVKGNSMHNYQVNSKFINYIYEKVTKETLPKNNKNFLTRKERLSLIFSIFFTIFIPLCLFISVPLAEYNQSMISFFCCLLTAQLTYIGFKKIKQKYYNYDDVLKNTYLNSEDIDYLSSFLDKNDMKILLKDTETKNRKGKIVHKIANIFKSYSDLESFQSIANGEKSILLEKATVDFKRNHNLDNYLEHVYRKE